ncbi:MAG: S41 family peptidase [Myxococcota bacterium]|nr:S41 family peptidase [Myxococcota bacterium]
MKTASRSGRSSRVRLLLTFLGGVATAALAGVVVDANRSEAADRYQDLGLFSSVVDHVRRHYVEPIDEHELLSGAIRGMMGELDPHSAFMEPKQYKEMQIDTRGEFHGLGIEITKAPNSFVEVVSPIEGTPADRAGIRARDQIVRICPTERPDEWEESEECRSTERMTLPEAVSLMRGKKGTEITVHIYREGFEEPRPYTVVRDVVQIESVAGEMLEPGYGYLRIRQFQERTAADLEDELERFAKEAPDGLSGVVLDLRDNPGGLLDQGVRVANLWLDDGLIVYTQGRDDSQRQDFRAHAAGTQPSYPLVVIVNEGSASASEIVAGALQDQQRALVLGVATFGKGSVQTVYPIGRRYGLRLTTALYYTPSGRSIQEVGIEPDIEVRPQARRAPGAAPRRVRERDLHGHFTHEEAEPDEADELDEPEGEDEARDQPAEGDGSSRREDLQVRRALEVLKSWTYFERLRSDEPEPILAAEAPSPTD